MDQIWLWLGVVVVCAGLMVSAVERRLLRTERRLARIERKLDSALDHLGIPQLGPELSQVDTLLRQGKKIQAIKVYRDATGVDLKGAKEAVERMADKN